MNTQALADKPDFTTLQQPNFSTAFSNSPIVPNQQASSEVPAALQSFEQSTSSSNDLIFLQGDNSQLSSDMTNKALEEFIYLPVMYDEVDNNILKVFEANGKYYAQVNDKAYEINAPDLPNLSTDQIIQQIELPIDDNVTTDQIIQQTQPEPQFVINDDVSTSQIVHQSEQQGCVSNADLMREMMRLHERFDKIELQMAQQNEFAFTFKKFMEKRRPISYTNVSTPDQEEGENFEHFKQLKRIDNENALTMLENCLSDRDYLGKYLRYLIVDQELDGKKDAKAFFKTLFRKLVAPTVLLPYSWKVNTRSVKKQNQSVGLTSENSDDRSNSGPSSTNENINDGQNNIDQSDSGPSSTNENTNDGQNNIDQSDSGSSNANDNTNDDDQNAIAHNK